MKRRIISIAAVLCAVVLAVSFVGCGKNKNKNDEEKESYFSIFVETGEPIELEEIPLED